MRLSTIILLTAFGLLIVSAIMGNYLESSGIMTREKLGARGVAAVMVFYFGLFCAIAFSAVPLLLRFFLAGQVIAGNAEQPSISWLQAHEQTIVYAVWGVFAAGLVIAFVLARDKISTLLR